jgi:hypothetical protein
MALLQAVAAAVVAAALRITAARKMMPRAVLVVAVAQVQWLVVVALAVLHMVRNLTSRVQQVQVEQQLRAELLVYRVAAQAVTGLALVALEAIWVTQAVLALLVIRRETPQVVRAAQQVIILLVTVMLRG